MHTPPPEQLRPRRLGRHGVGRGAHNATVKMAGALVAWAGVLMHAWRMPAVKSGVVLYAECAQLRVGEEGKRCGVAGDKVFWFLLGWGSRKTKAWGR